MKVWITKYALTKGVIVTEAEVYTPTSYPMIDARPHGFFNKPDWHDTEEDAILRVQKMVSAKISSLESQLSKLRRLEIKIFDEGLSCINEGTTK